MRTTWMIPASPENTDEMTKQVVLTKFVGMPIDFANSSAPPVARTQLPKLVRSSSR